MKRTTSGFTIVELLIVIVVIAILAAISIAVYSGIRERAQVAALADGLNKVEKAMRLWAIEEGYAHWPIDPVVGGGTRFIDLYETYPSLNNYLQTPPAVTGIHDEDWFYDNDGDTKTECGRHYDGVNIVIRFVEDRSIAQALDTLMDDGNLSCGKIRYTDNRIFYSISYVQEIR